MVVVLSGEVNPVHLEVSAALGALSARHNLPRELVVAEVVKSVATENSPLGKLLQFAVDEAADQFISEELYQRHSGLLEFLAACGCDDEEVQFKSYVQTHSDIFVCKTADCPGKIVGGCPKMYCEFCGKPYFVNIEGISDQMCTRCVSKQIGECDERSRKRRHQIFAVKTVRTVQ